MPYVRTVKTASGATAAQIVCSWHRGSRDIEHIGSAHARRTRRGIDEQVAKAQQAVGGNAPVKRNRFIQLSGGTRSVNRELEEKARALAGPHVITAAGPLPSELRQALDQINRRSAVH